MTSLIVAGIIVVAAVVGFASKFFLGNDNEIETVAEHVIDQELGLPLGTIQFPDVPEKAEGKTPVK
jgi:hypothetical protein